MESIIKGKSHEITTPEEECLTTGPLDPCGIVIFGATGDLTSRKLAPALYNLYLTGTLPDRFFVLGAARSELDDEQFRDRIKKTCAEKDPSKWEEFADHVHYHQVQFDSTESFQELKDALESLNEEYQTEGNRIFWLAIPPSLYKQVARMLGTTGLSCEGDGRHRWSRLVVEKPVGRDLESAQDLNSAVEKHFQEPQVFRIDHYLAKETVQNVLVFRFANTVFEPLWNRNFIDRVEIMAVESIGVANRAEYYEESGVIRDMFQNHMMQLLALTAMEPPSIFDAEAVRDEKIKVFKSLRPLSPDRFAENVVLGQYGPGVVDGEEVAGYRQEPGIAPDSITPTFARLRVDVDNWRWQGVPFYLTSGKALAEKRTEIRIHFKPVPHALFRDTLGLSISPNILTLGIYPDEKINLTFQTKLSGAKVCLRSVTMEFHYHENHIGPILDAYEKAILDTILGDQTLFWRQDAVEACWAYFDPILNRCDEICSDREAGLITYPAGSRGPEGAEL